MNIAWLDTGDNIYMRLSLIGRGLAIAATMSLFAGTALVSGSPAQAADGRIADASQWLMDQLLDLEGGTAKADFDGDGVSDIGLYRAATGEWHLKSVKRNVQLYGSYPYGGNGSDIPLSGDFDGDGFSDIALYRKSEGQWHIKSVKRNVLHGSYEYGGNGSDIPLVGDFDGHGYDDIALYRASEGTWHIKSVKRNVQLHAGYPYGGQSSDIPINK